MSHRSVHIYLSPAGTFNDDMDARSCEECAAGMISTEGSAACKWAPLNFYQDQQRY